MGRSFESVRMGCGRCFRQVAQGIRALKKEDQIYGQMIAEMAKMHSSEAFYCLEESLFVHSAS